MIDVEPKSGTNRGTLRRCLLSIKLSVKLHLRHKRTSRWAKRRVSSSEGRG